MSVIDHGTWVRYWPEIIPEDAPPHTMFCKREHDGVDWYDYVNSGENFKKESLKLTVMVRETNGPTIVSAPTTDPTMLFPAGHRVIEVAGEFGKFSADDLISTFASKIVDIKTGAVSDPPSPPTVPAVPDLVKLIEDLSRRIAVLESKG